MSIPGLFCLPEEGIPTDCEDLTLMSFSLKTFAVPGAHRYGRCRPVTEYERISILADGTYGTVYKAKDKTSGEIVALKKLRMPKEPELLSQNIIREISNLKLLKHENITNLICVAVGKNVESTHLITEYCPYSLSKVVDKVNRRYLGYSQIRNIMGQIFCGLDHIHKHGIFHRELSSMNILFDDTGTLKINDFGLSRKMSSGAITPNQGFRWYKPPEVLFGAKHYSASVDIWAAGCILAEMLRLRVLFPGSSDYEVIKLIIDFLGTPTESLWPGYSRLPVPHNYSFKFQPYNRIRSSFASESIVTVSFITKMLLYNPNNRPTAEQCLENQYFSEYPPACTREELLPTLLASTL